MEEHPLHSILTRDYKRWVPLFVRWEALREQIAFLEERRAWQLSINDRDRQLAKIERKLAILCAELPETQPAERYLISDAKIVCDTWSEFVSFWRELQSTYAYPVNPLGVELKSNGMAAEMWAWQQLVGGTFNATS